MSELEPAAQATLETAPAEPTNPLEWLRRLAPPEQVVVVGAGGGRSQWLSCLRDWDPPRVVLVEGEPDEFRRLQTWLHDAVPDCAHRRWTLLPSVVGRAEEGVEFYRASLHEASGTLSPAQWSAVWPNLRTVARRTVSSVGLDALLRPVGPCNWLLIDCLPAQAVLEEAPVALDTAEVVAARVTVGSVAVSTGADLETVQAGLALRGFQLLSITALRHPRLAHAYFVRDHRTAWRHAQRQADAEREKASVALADLASRCAQAEAALRQREQELAALTQRLEDTRALIVQQPAAAARTAAQSVADGLVASVAKQQANAVRQIESFIGIHNFLNTGRGLGEFHGWPISPDLGAFLLQRLAEHAYDLIVEFGSGTSTAMFAQAVEVLAQRAAAEGKSAGTRIVSFDHDAHYFQRTLRLLSSQGLAHRVDLRHAPLVEQTWADRPFSFYDAAGALAGVEQAARGRALRVLVLVDGPPAKTCPLARFPALPVVMSQLGRHAIDIVLDDSHRAEEREVVALWTAMLQAQGRVFTTEALDCEKGAVCLRLSVEQEPA